MKQTFAVLVAIAGASSTVAIGAFALDRPASTADAVASIAALAAAPTASFSNGVWRTSPGQPTFYLPQTGTCAENHLVNDGGACIDTTGGDGNSWKANFGPTIQFEQFGAKGDGVADDSAAINRAIAYACTSGGKMIVPGQASVYAVAAQLVDHCGTRVFASLSRINVWYTGFNDVPKAPVIFKWIGGGSATPFYMVDIGAPSDTGTTGRRLYDDMWTGVMFDCDGAEGCGGALVHSVAYSYYNMSAWEPRPAIQVANGRSAAKQNLLNLRTTKGLSVGMSVASYVSTTASGASAAGQNILMVAGGRYLTKGMVALSGYIPANAHITNIKLGEGGEGKITLSQNIAYSFSGSEPVNFSRFAPGAQIAAIIGPTQIALTSNIQSAFSGDEEVGIGGEGFRFDVTPNLDEANDTQINTINALTVRNTGSGIQGPAIVLGATNVAEEGSGRSLTHYGNFSANQVRYLECSYICNAAIAIVLGSADHNLFGLINAGAPNVSAGGSQVVVAGYLPDARTRGMMDTASTFDVGEINGNFTVEGTELGFGAPTELLAIDLRKVDLAGDLAGIAVGIGNHGVQWRFDRIGQWNRNDAVINHNGVLHRGQSLFSSTAVVPNNPRGLTPTTDCLQAGGGGAMAGLGTDATSDTGHTSTISPAVTGAIDVSISGIASVLGGHGAATLYLYQGTGAAPGNGVTSSGLSLAIANFQTVSGGATTNFTLTGKVFFPAALAYPPTKSIWVDICAGAGSAGETVTLRNLSVSMREHD